MQNAGVRDIELRLARECLCAKVLIYSIACKIYFPKYNNKVNSGRDAKKKNSKFQYFNLKNTEGIFMIFFRIKKIIIRNNAFLFIFII